MLNARQAARRSSSLLMNGHGEAGGRIEHGEVQPEFVEALVEQTRDHRGRAIERVAGREGPPALLRTARIAAFVHGELEIAHDPSVARVEGVGHAGPGHALEVFADSRSEFEPMAVGIDHGMAEPCANRRGIGSMTGRHRNNLLAHGSQYAGLRADDIIYRSGLVILRPACQGRGRKRPRPVGAGGGTRSEPDMAGNTGAGFLRMLPPGTGAKRPFQRSDSLGNSVLRSTGRLSIISSAESTARARALSSSLSTHFPFFTK